MGNCSQSTAPDYMRPNLIDLILTAHLLLGFFINLQVLFSNQVTRLREYQGVDPHFDTIARQYHDIVKVITMLTVAHYLVLVLNSKYYQYSLSETGKYAMDYPPS